MAPCLLEGGMLVRSLSDKVTALIDDIENAFTMKEVYARQLQSGKAAVMRQTQAPHNTGDTVRDVLEYYRCYLSRNRDLADHSTQFLKRENSDPKAAEAEAVVF